MKIGIGHSNLKGAGTLTAP